MLLKSLFKYFILFFSLGERKRTRFEHQKERELAFKKKMAVQRKLSVRTNIYKKNITG